VAVGKCGGEQVSGRVDNTLKYSLARPLPGSRLAGCFLLLSRCFQMQVLVAISLRDPVGASKIHEIAAVYVASLSFGVRGCFWCHLFPEASYFPLVNW